MSTAHAPCNNLKLRRASLVARRRSKNAQVLRRRVPNLLLPQTATPPPLPSPASSARLRPYILPARTLSPYHIVFPSHRAVPPIPLPPRRAASTYLSYRTSIMPVHRRVFSTSDCSSSNSISSLAGCAVFVPGYPPPNLLAPDSHRIESCSVLVFAFLSLVGGRPGFFRALGRIPHWIRLVLVVYSIVSRSPTHPHLHPHRRRR
ncbi:hypothetical protein PYCCODRAFT_435626 [Trametes coccinea BRFM310]|uniref:Uncharacterized protein n=1 Tax=Trametes coccinea (strain BRFM310) TaxID=1353009 RepID=A0A1Y2ILP8_TRAC3|nr:hypothetical protein PYCCODRAFT_435626 [Trametes coccinea BRFM310]